MILIGSAFFLTLILILFHQLFRRPQEQLHYHMNGERFKYIIQLRSKLDTKKHR